MDLTHLDTEQQNTATFHIDTMSTRDLLHAINQEDQKVPAVVETCIPQIEQLVDEASKRMKEGGRVIYIGAGTSGRLGVLDASECPPTYGVSDQLIQGLIAGGYGALLKAKEGAEDSETLAAQDLQSLHLNAMDTVIGLAASGRTPYVIGGLQYAKQTKALCGAISCVHHASISAYADIAIEAVTGPEAITGSTRMKAGTAQKLILNMISTALMVKYGKVYHNLMIDVQPTNEKLVERAIRIICAATDCTYEAAAKLFEESDHEVKLAICMALSQADKAACVAMLKNEQGNVSATIRNLLSASK